MATDCIRKRWRWVVTLSSFTQVSLVFGLLYCYSILFLSLQDEFQAGAALTGWVGSVANSLTFLMSPLSLAILRRISCRTGAIVAIFFYCVGLLCTSFATELWYMFLTFGVVVGCAANLSMMSGVTLLGRWFPDKYYSRALAFNALGSPVGMLIMSLVFPSLVSQFGWRGTLRILSAALFAVTAIVALLMKNPDHAEPTNRDDIDLEESIDHKTPLRDENTGPGEPESGGKCVVETQLTGAESEKLNKDAVETRVVKTATSQEDMHTPRMGYLHGGPQRF